MNLRRVVWTSALLLFLASGAALAAHTERVSLSTTGGQANGRSIWVSISADGRYVAFASEASNLVPGDTNGKWDVFVHDRLLGTTERVSVSTGGEEGDYPSEAPAISADGRFVAFFSEASNLVLGDTNTAWDVFVRDRLLGTTERVSVSSSGEEGDNSSGYDVAGQAISADGRFVAFLSWASNLVPGDTKETRHAYLRDRLLGTTEAIDVKPDGSFHSAGTSAVSISADGRFVSFGSGGRNYVQDDTNWASDVFVRDRLTGTTQRVSVGSEGQEGDDDSGVASISADGRFVAFRSKATNLVPGEPVGTLDYYVRDRGLGTTERVGANIIGPGEAFYSCLPSLSAHGRFAAFASFSPFLVPGDTNECYDIFLHDRVLDTTELVSMSTVGDQGNGNSGMTTTPNSELGPVSAISADGRFVAFYSEASNLVPGDTNSVADIFVRALDLEEATFSDVTATHWAYDEIEACADAGIVSGYDDGWYHPNYPVSRAQMAVFISRSICTPTGEAGMADYTPPATPTFPDVGTIYWAYKYVEYAAEHNVVGGYPDDLYHPNEPVNRGQMAVFVARALVTPSGDVAVLPGPPSPTFPDVTSSNAWSWCYDHVEHIAAQGVTQGYFDGYYHPEYTCTRDMMAVYIQRAFNLPM